MSNKEFVSGICVGLFFGGLVFLLIGLVAGSICEQRAAVKAGVARYVGSPSGAPKFEFINGGSK